MSLYITYYVPFYDNIYVYNIHLSQTLINTYEIIFYLILQILCIHMYI